MSRRKLNDRVIYIRSRARELAISSRFERWQGIEFELKFVEGLPEACALLAGAPMRHELDILCQQARSRAPIETSSQSKTQETLETLGELIAEYSAFQRSRPDLPQGSAPDLSQDKLELLVAAFQLHKAEQKWRSRLSDQRGFIDQRSGALRDAPSSGHGKSSMSKRLRCGTASMRLFLSATRA
jgi:hypothetical protein